MPIHAYKEHVEYDRLLSITRMQAHERTSILHFETDIVGWIKLDVEDVFTRASGDMQITIARVHEIDDLTIGRLGRWR
jgi:hypothetical protein